MKCGTGKDNMVRELTNEKVLEYKAEETTLRNNILRGKVNWIQRFLRRKFLLHDAIEGQMMGNERSRKKKNIASC